ncbi:MAG TPA: sigma 54-interacting transcriptional regulator [Gemmatimonadales bacterium]|nr:sigma 54-interacting transcriptional regulator [Gemmatimonadales bacterium]
MILGQSAGLRRALDLARRFATSRLPVLLVGPRGSGKELLARFIHEESGRKGEFVDVNCGALPEALAESLLFGHEPGAFTGARKAHIGLVQESHGGTLFLDEFGDLSPDCQTKVLRAFEWGEIRPVGARGKRQVDLRIVAAAQSNAEGRNGGNGLRQDLLDRVAVGIVTLPPLRDRDSDLIMLATHFARVDGRELEAGVDTVLRNYSWPGNVRELRAVIARAGCLVDNGTLPPWAVAEAIAMSGHVEGSVNPFPTSPAEWEALGARERWVASRMAKALGVGRTRLFKLLRAQGISLRQLRSSQGAH